MNRIYSVQGIEVKFCSLEITLFLHSMDGVVQFIIKHTVFYLIIKVSFLLFQPENLVYTSTQKRKHQITWLARQVI